MDRIDRQIITHLQEDGRRSNVEIARQLGVSEGTVRKRVDRMVAEGTLGIHGVVEPTKAGYPTQVVLLLDVDLTRLDQVSRELAAMPEVVSVHLMTGAHDLLAEVALASDDDLLRFLTRKVGPLPGVRDVVTSHVTRSPKRRHEWSVPEPPPPTVLIVDDDPDFVEVTRLTLEAEGYRVRSASSGQRALDALAEEPADLVILDIMMDGVLDGWDAGRRIRADGVSRDVPILVVSSITSTDYLGMVPTDDDNLIDYFLSKPVDPKVLLKHVGRLVGR